VAVDPSKLKKSSRRALGLPQTDGSPGIEESAVQAAEASTSNPQTHAGSRRDATPEVATEPTEVSRDPEPPLAWSSTAEAQSPPRGRGGASPVPDLEEDPTVRRVPATAGPGGEQQSFRRRHRVPPPDAEPRIPFTTRITRPTKERLEDACYHLRRRHQDFINEAIAAHLEKHGF
jgi:hypothetical protein